MMGAHIYEDDRPLMCFNGAKSWYSNWYNDRRIAISNPSTPSNVRLSGVDEYVKNRTVKDAHYVVAKVGDLFVMYNQAKGINAGVAGDGNMVTVTKQVGGTRKQSWELAALDVNQQYATTDWGGSGKLVIKVCKFVDGVPDFAHVLIYRDTGYPVSCGSLPPVGGPPTNSPTPAPTPRPTPFPTPRPTPFPTQSPTPVTNDRTGDDSSLETTLATNNSSDGNMFEVKAVSNTAVSIESFDVHLDSDTKTYDVEVWTKEGTFRSFEGNSAAWTRLLSTSVKGQGRGKYTTLEPLSQASIIPPGAIRSFYITVKGQGGFRYTNGSSEGATVASDGIIEINQGCGKKYSFADTYRPRIWNGRIHYSKKPTGGQWKKISFDNFENGLGNWSLGGSDAKWQLSKNSNVGYIPEGQYAIKLRDDSGDASSVELASTRDVRNYSNLRVTFAFKARSMEEFESFFLEYHDGTRWNVVRQWIYGTDFQNGIQTTYKEEIDFKGVGFAFTPTSQANIRFRCHASGRMDFIYIDEVLFEGQE